MPWNRWRTAGDGGAESSVEHEECVVNVLLSVLHLLAVDEGGGRVDTILAEHVDELLPHLERGAAGAHRWNVNLHVDGSCSMPLSPPPRPPAAASSSPCCPQS
jgi:hypothetical protein